MEILNSIFSWLIKKRNHQIALFLQYPIEVQNEWLRRLCNTAQDTWWGKTYGYGDIRTVKDFKERVPLQDYEQLKPFVIRLKQGEQNLLWPSEVKWFAKSSGTTNSASKFIPVSQEALEECHYKGGKDMLSLYFSQYYESRLFSGRSLVVGGSQQVNQFSSDSYYGDLSSILIKNFPFWAEFRRTPNLSIALMPEWEEKIDRMAEKTAKKNVTNISGVPSWTLVLLKRILEITGKSSIHEVWPNLELYIHGGVSFKPYRKQYDKVIGYSDMRYLETYNASEGFFGIQNDLSDESLLLMLDYGIYYEFMPLEEVGNDHPHTLSLEEVELGVNYAMVISTNAGLWRYQLGDTVMFTSLKPFKLVVTGRTKHFINVFGEELIVDNADKALMVACQKTGAVIEEYTAAPIFMTDEETGGHEWLIEFNQPPEQLNYFTEVFDNALKSENSDYEAKRYQDMVLQKPLIRSLEPGTFYHWMKSRNKMGGQNKVPRLSNRREFVEDILQYVTAQSEG